MRCSPATEQSIRRFTGISLVLGGLGFALAWMVAPIDAANAVAGTVLGVALLVVALRYAALCWRSIAPTRCAARRRKRRGVPGQWATPTSRSCQRASAAGSTPNYLPKPEAGSARTQENRNATDRWRSCFYASEGNHSLNRTSTVSDMILALAPAAPCRRHSPRRYRSVKPPPRTATFLLEQICHA